MKMKGSQREEEGATLEGREREAKSSHFLRYSLRLNKLKGANETKLRGVSCLGSRSGLFPCRAHPQMSFGHTEVIMGASKAKSGGPSLAKFQTDWSLSESVN